MTGRMSGCPLRISRARRAGSRSSCSTACSERTILVSDTSPADRRSGSIPAHYRSLRQQQAGC
jgi:hypothetical protein